MSRTARSRWRAPSRRPWSIIWNSPRLPSRSKILLRVKFAELDRTRPKSATASTLVLAGGPDRLVTLHSAIPSISSTSADAGTGGSSASNVLSVASGAEHLRVRSQAEFRRFHIRRCRAEGILQILAEPNLVTTNGKEASFLVGGEFPVPVLQGGGNAGAVTVQFQGIRHPADVHSGAHREQHHQAAPESGSFDPRYRRWRDVQRLRDSGAFDPAQRKPTSSWAKDRASWSPGLVEQPGDGELLEDPCPGQPADSRQPLQEQDENKTRTDLVVLVTPEMTDAARSERSASPRSRICPKISWCAWSQADMPGREG